MSAQGLGKAEGLAAGVLRSSPVRQEQRAELFRSNEAQDLPKLGRPLSSECGFEAVLRGSPEAHRFGELMTSLSGQQDPLHSAVVDVGFEFDQFVAYEGLESVAQRRKVHDDRSGQLSHGGAVQTVDLSQER